jgi:glycosyltransferase involved in cell wall biosynthesis
MVAWNEEQILPYALRHYERFASRIYVYDNMSTDATGRIVDAHALAHRIVFDSGETQCDSNLLAIKNHAWKSLSRAAPEPVEICERLRIRNQDQVRALCRAREAADFVCLVDADEILFCPDMTEVLRAYKAAGVTLPRVEGYEMVSDHEPPSCDIATGSITDHIRSGVRCEAYDEQVVFSPVLDLEFAPGCHWLTRCQGPVTPSERADIRFLHYKMLSKEYYVQRNSLIGPRSSTRNVRCGYGFQHRWPRERLERTWQDHWERRTRVI